MDVSRISRAFFLFAISGLSAPAALSQPADGAQPKAIAHIRFYDKDYAQGHNFCSVPVHDVPWFYSGGFFGCTKDEARSAKLEDLPPGTVIKLYDDTGCGDSDDYATITVTKFSHSIIVEGFKSEVSNEYWNIKVYYENGLMGKVSCAEVDVPGPNGYHTRSAIVPSAKK